MSILKNKNKLIMVLIALILSFTSIMATADNFNVKADNFTVPYIKCNAQTGAILGTYNLRYTPQVNNRMISYPDSRVIDWTKSGVVKLLTTTNYEGTGFVVGEHIIATAAHCLKNKNISEILLFDSNGNVDMHATPVESHYPANYNYNPSDDEDYGLITVEEDLSDYMCFDLASPMSVNQSSVSITGFPRTSNTHYTHNCYTGTGNITSSTAERLAYDVNVSDGNCGSPIYITESYMGNVCYSVIGIHTREGVTENFGKLMTFNMFHFYMNNENNINY